MFIIQLKVLPGVQHEMQLLDNVTVNLHYITKSICSPALTLDLTLDYELKCHPIPNPQSSM